MIFFSNKAGENFNLAKIFLKRESPTLNINVELKINRKYQNAGKN